jgi:HlyD family secretion protein
VRPSERDKPPATERDPEWRQEQPRPTSPPVVTAKPHPLIAIEPTGPQTPRTRLRRGLLLSIASGVAVGTGLLWWWLVPAMHVVHYKTVPVDRGKIVAVVTATGTVNPVASVQVGSQVSGTVHKLFADFNSLVTKGRVIAQIDPAPFRAKVNQARAGLKTALGTLDKAQTALAQRNLELERATALHGQGFVSQSELDLARTNARDAEAQADIGQAQVDQARAALASAELDLAHTTIYSPVAGIVVSRNVDVGQTVAASLQAPTLFVIAQDLTRMQVNANVSESDIGGVAEGKAAEFTVDAYPAEPFSGTVTQVRNAPISIQNVVTYDVVIDVDNRALKLKPGMTANVSILTASADDALRVPSAALRFRPSGAPVERKKSVVWMPGAGGELRAVPIKAGIADASYTEVSEGDLQAGDAVIVGIMADDEGGTQELPPGFGVGPKIR